jgi:hypothetical protein
VHLVEKDHHRPGGVPHLVADLLELLRKRTAQLGAGQQGGHVQLDDAAVFQGAGVGGVLDDAQGQALDDGGLAGAGLADQQRVVGAPFEQGVDDLGDFLVAAHQRVDLAQGGQGGDVAPQLGQKREAGGLQVPGGLRGRRRRRDLVVFLFRIVFQVFRVLLLFHRLADRGERGDLHRLDPGGQGLLLGAFLLDRQPAGHAAGDVGKRGVAQLGDVEVGAAQQVVGQGAAHAAQGDQQVQAVDGLGPAAQGDLFGFLLDALDRAGGLALDGVHQGQDGVLVDVLLFQQDLGAVVDGEERQQQVGRGEALAHLGGDVLGLGDDLSQLGAGVHGHASPLADHLWIIKRIGL